MIKIFLVSTRWEWFLLCPIEHRGRLVIMIFMLSHHCRCLTRESLTRATSTTAFSSRLVNPICLISQVSGRLSACMSDHLPVWLSNAIYLETIVLFTASQVRQFVILTVGKWYKPTISIIGRGRLYICYSDENISIDMNCMS